MACKARIGPRSSHQVEARRSKRAISSGSMLVDCMRPFSRVRRGEQNRGVSGDLDQHRQPEMGKPREIEGDLLEAQQSVLRMVEAALAALPHEHRVLVPESREIRAVPM